MTSPNDPAKSSNRPRPRPSWIAPIWRALPWLLTAAIFVSILRHISLDQALSSLSNVPILKFFGLFLPLSVSYLFLDSLCLKWVTGRFNASIPFRDLVAIRASMYLPALVNNNLGLAGVSYYLHRRFGVRFLGGLSSVLFVAFIDVYEVFLFSGIGMLFYMPEEQALKDLVATLRVVYAIAWALLLVLMILGFIARRRPSVSQWIVHTKIGAFMGTFLKATPLDYVVLLLLKAVGFVLILAVQYATLRIYGLTPPLAKLITFLPLVYLALAIPFTVAQLGPAEGAWLVLFASDGAPNQLFVYAIAAHLIFMACLAAIGFCFLHRASRDLSATAPEPPEQSATAL
jgi:hypothetical protein